MTTPPSYSQRGAVAALVAAFLGWLFDGFEMGLFPLIGQPALQDLLPAETALVRGQWFTVIIAVFLVGAATGGVLFGWLGDKLGRVKAMTLAIFTYAIFTGLSAFVTQPWQFAGLRFTAALGMGGDWSLGVALVNEVWGGRNRGWIAGLIGAASNIGFLLTGVLSLKLNESLAQVTQGLAAIGISTETANYLLHNRAWRFLAISGALPALINFFILAFVHESPRWQEEKSAGRTSQWAPLDLAGVAIAALAGMGIIAIWSPLVTVGNAVAIPATLLGLAIALWGYLLPVRNYLRRTESAGNLVAGERSTILRHLLIGAALAGVALLGTWGSVQQAAKWASGLVPTSSRVPIIEYTVIATALGAILIAFLAPLVADRLGRRTTFTLLSVCSLGIALAFFQTNHVFVDGVVSTWFYVSAFLMGGLTASFYGFFPLYFPELFPTSVRATGQGFCYNFGRLLAAIGSLQIANLTGLFTRSDLTPVQISANAYSILSCIYLAGLVLIRFAPETKGRALT
ncbi:MAG: MFS transporter [Opitutus sp.]